MEKGLAGTCHYIAGDAEHTPFPDNSFDVIICFGVLHHLELEDAYPGLPPKERENAYVKEHKTVFITQIGGALRSGIKHDNRAPDYDDWSTPNEDGYVGLNGDIILWNNVLKISFEISSMGIRVDKEALKRQLDICGCPERSGLTFHKALLNDELPASIGGGIGQSRLCMKLFLTICSAPMGKKP